MTNYRQLKAHEEKEKRENENKMIQKLLEDKYLEEIQNLSKKLDKEREERAELEQKTMQAEKNPSDQQ